MALPQGINFRTTAGPPPTDGANETYEIVASGTQNYPHTTAQGNNVGWETTDSNYASRDRNSSTDRRLTGINFNASIAPSYRIDLPSAGNYNIGIAAGDFSYTREVNWDLYDSGTNLGSLTTGTTASAANFKDATNTEYTYLTWPTNQTLVSKTFSTTICRFTSVGVNQVIAHVYVESGAAAEILMGDGEDAF